MHRHRKRGSRKVVSAVRGTTLDKTLWTASPLPRAEGLVFVQRWTPELLRPCRNKLRTGETLSDVEGRSTVLTVRHARVRPHLQMHTVTK